MLLSFMVAALSANFQSSPTLAPGLSELLRATVDDNTGRQWQVGLAVMSCRHDSLLFGYNATTPLCPASNQKLLVTACAFDNWNDTLVGWLDSLLNRNPSCKRQAAADSLGMNRYPDFPGYRHLVLANRHSDNLEADWMLASLSRRARKDGHALLCHFLDRKEIPRRGTRVWDGSGLSRRNRVSPLTLAQLLSRVHSWPRAEVFRSSLAVPGQLGTLIHRPLAVGSRLAAKTGYVRGVFALSGYLSCQNDTYAFSFILNNCTSGTQAYQFFNALLNALDEWDTRELANAPRLKPDSTGN